VLVLLPPSEGKKPPVRGRHLDLSRLSAPSLTPAREQVLSALIGLAASDAPRAATVLGLGPTQLDEVARDARLRTAPTARADAVYSGVLFAALDLAGLDSAARRRATRQVLVASALFGLLRPDDRVPAYRLSGDVRLPGLGPVSALWRQPYAELLPELVGGGLLLDLRSTTYAAFWRPYGDLARRTVTVRVLVRSGGRLQVLSHANKAAKGRIVRDLLLAGASPRRPRALADALRDLGWCVSGEGRLDVVVDQV
jgi:hypothetical protein